MNGCHRILEMTLKFKVTLTTPKTEYFFLEKFLSAKPFIGVERLALDHRVKATSPPLMLMLHFDFGPPTNLMVAAELILKIGWGWFSFAGLLQISFYYLWLPSNR